MAAGDEWYGWDQVTTKVFPKRAPIGALSRDPPGQSVYHVEILIVDGTHRMQSTSRSPGGVAGDGWEEWTQVGSTKFQPSTEFAVLDESRFKHVLALGDDGLVHWCLRGSGDWGAWTPIQGVTFADGTPVSAVWSHPPPGPRSGFPGLYVDCFAVGPDGRVQTASLHATEWSPWSAVQQKTFPPRTPVAAVSATPGSIDVYAIAADGRLWRAHQEDADAAWGPWKQVASGTITFAERTPVTAASHEPGRIELFSVSACQWVQHIARTTADGFGTWRKLHPGSPFLRSTRVAASFTPSRGLQVLAVPGTGRELKVSRRHHSSPGWSGWDDVPAKSQPHVFPAGAPATTVRPRLRDNVQPQPPPRTVPEMIVFAVDDQGLVHSVLQPVLFL